MMEKNPRRAQRRALLMKRRRRRRILTAVVAAAGAIALAALTLALLNKPAPDRATPAPTAEPPASEAAAVPEPEPTALSTPTPELTPQPTPTPQPIVVYCNQGGKYYHVKECKWVRPTTPSVTLAQAIRAGYKPCPDCDAPEAVS